MKGLAEIDGSLGEGGGQILRTSLTLSALTGYPLHIFNVRAKRSKPGLRPQHVQCVRAIAQISSASVENAHIGSTEIYFEPKGINTGTFSFDIGTAGSVSLVLQCIFFPLAMQRADSLVSIIGGTHVPMSPCFHYLQHQWLPHVASLGFKADLKMDRAGYYPAGGGELVAEIHAPETLKPLELKDRGKLEKIRGLSAVSNLPLSIAERQVRRSQKGLRHLNVEKNIQLEVLPSPGMGTVLFLVSEFEHSQACYFGLGAKGKPAERVADEACHQLDQFLRTRGAVDRFLADQLLLPLCMVEGASHIATEAVTQHLLTNAEVIRKFLPAQITIQGQPDTEGLVSIKSSGLNRR